MADSLMKCRNINTAICCVINYQYTYLCKHLFIYQKRISELQHSYKTNDIFNIQSVFCVEHKIVVVLNKPIG